MGRVYYKKLPLFHLYDSDLTGTLMVGKYPDLERGESASETGRTHIPPRLFKEAVHLNRMKDQIMAILNDSNPFNKKSKAEELETLLDKYVPGVEAMRTKLKKYDKTYKELTAENTELEKELNSASRESIQKKTGDSAQAFRTGRASPYRGCHPRRGYPCLHSAEICASRSNESGNLRQ